LQAANVADAEQLHERETLQEKIFKVNFICARALQLIAVWKTCTNTLYLSLVVNKLHGVKVGGLSRLGSASQATLAPHYSPLFLLSNDVRDIERYALCYEFSFSIY
jgi:hypothetical protein